MRRIFVAVVAGLFFIPSFAFSTSAFADQYVHGYTRSNGTYVQPYYRSSPNGTVTDNFSYKGNVNPYNGSIGTNRYIHDKTSPYFQGPDSHGRVGHNGASDPAGYRVNELGVNEPQDYWVAPRGSISQCPPPHFRMTERDGCQAVH
jgi:hypothetical protein